MVSTEQIADDLRDTLSHAKACHEIWWGFIGDRENRDSITQTANSYLHFFVPAVTACYCTYVVKLASVFDDHDDSISLKLLLERIEKSPSSVAPPINEIRSEFDCLRLDGRKLFKVRNKLVAHRNIKKFSTDFPAETKFQLRDLKRVLDETIAVFGKMYFHVRGHDGGIQDISADEDVDNVMRKLGAEFPYRLGER